MGSLPEMASVTPPKPARTPQEAARRILDAPRQVLNKELTPEEAAALRYLITGDPSERESMLRYGRPNSYAVFPDNFVDWPPPAGNDRTLEVLVLAGSRANLGEWLAPFFIREAGSGVMPMLIAEFERQRNPWADLAALAIDEFPLERTPGVLSTAGAWLLAQRETVILSSFKRTHRPERVQAFARTLETHNPALLEFLASMALRNDRWFSLDFAAGLLQVGAKHAEAVERYWTALPVDSWKVRLGVRFMEVQPERFLDPVRNSISDALAHPRRFANPNEISSIAGYAVNSFGDACMPLISQAMLDSEATAPLLSLIETLGDRGLPVLLVALSHQDPDTRFRAMSRLAELNRETDEVRAALQRDLVNVPSVPLVRFAGNWDRHAFAGEFKVLASHPNAAIRQEAKKWREDRG